MIRRRPSFYAKIKRPYGKHRWFGRVEYEVRPIGFSFNGVESFEQVRLK